MTDEHRSHGALVTPNEYYRREFLERQQASRAFRWSRHYKPEILVTRDHRLAWKQDYKP